MLKELIIASSPHETKVAILEDDQLAEVNFERAQQYSIAGGIFKGRVTRVLPGMQSAFVDIGLDRDAFLYVSDFLEDIEEYDKIVTGVEDKVARMNHAVRVEPGRRQLPTPAVAAPQEPDAPARTVSSAPPAGPRPAVAGVVPRPDTVEPAAQRPGVADTPSERAAGPTPPDAVSAPAGNGGNGGEIARASATADDLRQEERGRGRRRRGRRRRFRDRGFPESKYASRSEVVGPPVAASPEPAAPRDYEPTVLPGESLAKYQRRSESSPAAPHDPTQDVADDMAHGEANTPPSGRSVSERRLPLPTRAAGALSPEPAPLDETPPPEPVVVQHAPDSAAAAALEEAAEAVLPYVPFARPVPDSPPDVLDDAVIESAENAADATLADAAALAGAELNSAATQTAGAEDDAVADATDDAAADVAEDAAELAADAAEDAADLAADAAEDAADAAEDAAELAADAVEDAAELAADAAEDAADLAADAELEAGQEAEAPLSGQAEIRGPAQSARFMQRAGRRMRRGRGRSRFEQPLERAAMPGVPSRPERPARGQGQPLISDLLREGQEIIVQISKEPLGKKGARITSHIALPGRYLVYMPTVEHVGVSRKIASDEERARLKRILLDAKRTIPGGFIVRTAGEGRSEEDLRQDIQFLHQLWLDIRAKAEKKPAPALLHGDLNLVERILRDQLSENFSAIWVDNEQEYEKILGFVQNFQPSLVPKVKLYTKSVPIFEEFNIQEEIDKALQPKVWLKSGGYIVINQTEALVAIDVNTGKYVGKTPRLEDTIVKTNVDAIKEIVRQIRLRDLGGIIVIDFIDMDERKNRAKVMQALEEALRHDRAPSKALAFNDFGLVAITRKRVKQSLERTLCAPCPVCSGSGYLKSPHTVAMEILAEAHKLVPTQARRDITLRVNPVVARYLKQRDVTVIQEIEEMTHHSLIIKSDPSLQQEAFDFN